MQHTIVYSEPGMYAGWPANHGAWQWGDEFLVGFLRGRFKRKSMHNIAEPFELMQARSLDGGRTWQAQPARIPVDVIGEPTTPWDISDSIVRVRGSYDHGGDFIDPPGCFYASEDRGATWRGPHGFVGLESLFASPMINTSRTRVLGDLLFMSRADGRMWGTDETHCVRHVGEGRFEVVGTVAADEARAVMPAAARVDGRLVVVCRRRKSTRRGGWVEAFGSDDGGKQWRALGEVGETGGRNGNPPALIALPDGSLLCAYANRTERRIVGARSIDRGARWKQFVIRDGGDDDIGYPQLFLRSDGVPVCVYYWADAERPQQHIAATAVESLPPP
jgi:BNR repeat-like domain